MIGGIPADFIPPNYMEYVPVVVVLTPSGSVYQRGFGVTNVPSASISHNQYSTTASVKFVVFLWPANVSWKWVEVREGFSLYHRDGVYTAVQGEHQAWAWVKVMESQTSARKWELARDDESAPPSVQANLLPSLGPLFPGGGRIWSDIPWEYRVPASEWPDTPWDFGKVFVETTLSEGGQVNARKQNVRWSVNWSDPTTAGAQFQ
jgi:hypothetical protein